MTSEIAAASVVQRRNPPQSRSVRIRGEEYPLLLPSIRDPRLHLASVIVSLQILGQTAFDFRLSIAQILVSLLTCAVLEVSIAFRRQHVLMWPASALLTGNGVAFILRVPGTEHGDWWSLRGWWIYAGTAAISLLSKYVIRVGGRHVFNPSNFGLVVCFLALGSARAEPLDFWWGPMSVWLALAIALIVGGGLMILRRLRLLGVAVGFWLVFAAGIALLAAVDHVMTARWHLGPIVGAELWWTLVFSPEILVFLFFMITDPKTVPEGAAARRAFGVSIGLLAVLLIAPQVTEFATKVAVLTALVLVCAARPVIEWLTTADRTALLVERVRRPIAVAGRAATASLSIAGTTAALAVVALIGVAARPGAEALGPAGSVGAGGLPEIEIVPSDHVSTRLDERTAAQITSAALAELGIPAGEVDRASVTLEPGPGQGPPIAVATLFGVAPVRFERTFELSLVDGAFEVTGEREGAGGSGGSDGDAGGAEAASADGPPTVYDPVGFVAPGLEDVAGDVGLDFRHGAFRWSVSPGDPVAMMGAGLCWLDYDGDGWLDLYVVNSHSELDVARWRRSGSLPRSALFHNDRGRRFTDVSAGSGANLALRGSGCVAADFDLDGRTDLYVTSSTYDALLWNRGDGVFVEGARAAGIDDYGWHAGAAVGDVNGDGRPDLFVSGYTDVNAPIAESFEGFPSNHLGVRDLLYLNQGPDSRGRTTFREVGEGVGIDPGEPQHGLGAVLTDFDGDRRLDIYVANDEDPNRLYRNVAWPGGVEADPEGLGFRFRDVARQEGVDNEDAGMGIATGDYDRDGRSDLLVSNARGQQHAVYRGRETAAAGAAYADVRREFTPAFGTEHTGWGTSWLDLDLDADLDLVLANGAIPVSDLAEDAEPIAVLENVASSGESARFVDQGSGESEGQGGRDRLRIDGRGLAAADYDNDGDADVAINTIGGPLVLLENTGGRGNWLQVALDGFHPGTRITATLRDGTTLTREVHAGSSYLSSEDPRALFGLGDAGVVRELEVRYPDGRRARLTDIPANQLVTAPAG